MQRYFPQYMEGDDYLCKLLIVPEKPGEHSRMNISEGGETGAVFVKKNLMPRELYHTDWTADHALSKSVTGSTYPPLGPGGTWSKSVCETPGL